MKQASAPLPFLTDTTGRPGFIKDFSFSSRKGIYRWDNASRVFLKEKDTTLILIRFPMPGQPGTKCLFFLYDFEFGKTRTKSAFPVKIQATLFAGDKEVLSIRHQTSISESMISKISSEIKSDSLRCSFELKREGSFAVKSGKLSSAISIYDGRNEVMRSTLDIDIDYHPPFTYSFQHIRIQQNLFTTELSGTIDYGSINPTSNSYDQEFNKNTHLELMNSDDHGIIGDIVLSPVGDDGRFDYFIRFSDKSESRLKDQIIVLKKLFRYLK
ncbi:MAG: hypothetical protein NTW31_00030 [Bacteroidetes bacterium]|nr:hypothetical protein [Bacteroidota bacterium]